MSRPLTYPTDMKIIDQPIAPLDAIHRIAGNLERSPLPAKFTVPIGAWWASDDDDDLETFAEFLRVWKQWGEDVKALAVELGADGSSIPSTGGFGITELIGFHLLEGSEVPDGWRLTKQGHIAPLRKKGSTDLPTVTEFHRLRVVPSATDAVSGTPRTITVSAGESDGERSVFTPRVIEHNGVLLLVTGAKPDECTREEIGGNWVRMPLSSLNTLLGD